MGNSYYEKEESRSYSFAQLLSLQTQYLQYTGSFTTRMGNLSSAFEKADSQWKQIFKCRLEI